MSLGFDDVDPEPNRANSSYKPSPSTSEPQPTASQVTVVHHPHSEPNGREHNPPMEDSPVPYAPSPPEPPTLVSVPSDEEIYGHERYAGYRADYPEYASSTPGLTPSVRFDPTPFVMGGMQTDPLVQRDFKDDLVRAAGVVTPGVSDVPYIRYALEAITGQSGESSRVLPGNNRPAASNSAYLPRPQTTPQFNAEVSQPPPIRQSLVAIHDRDDPVSRGWQTPFHAPVTPRIEQQTPTDEQQPLDQPARQVVRQPERSRMNDMADTFYRAKTLVEQSYVPQPPNQSPPRTVDLWRAQPDSTPNHDLEAMGYDRPVPPPLTHKPWILRAPSLLLLAVLCILIIIALIFSAVYSIGHNGFTSYAGTIYGGQYFLFRVLPQLVGAVLLIYAQCVIAAVFRVFPFSAMASDNRTERRNAVFLPLYPKSFLWPQLFGPWHVWVPTIIVWLMNFTIPLLSSLYTVVLVDGVWRWSTVQGVAWTLVALYVSLLVSTIVLFVFWRHRRTGMIETWDVRSIADVVFLLAPSNSLPQYRGLETAATRGKMRKILGGTAERLGYWTTPEVPENKIFWGIGVPTTKEDLELEKADNKNWAAVRDESRPLTLPDVEDPKQPWTARFRYLPWCFRDSQIIFLVVAVTALLLVLFVVSFLPSTDLRDGFLPLLSAAPLAGAFSPADFLYSFLPSLIGLALFLVFQSLESTLRILAPWGELAREEGSRAEKSLLLDYATSLPWQSTLKAIRLKHWRVAAVTFLAPLFVLIPVLSGGLFMALTPPSGVVHVYPNVPIFALILALLLLYLVALISLVPSRKQFRLPHAVTCLAEIISFCCNEQLRTDDAFDQVKISTRTDLRAALDCGKDWHRQGRWTFGTGKNGEERLGIKRYSKFTVNPTKLRQYDKYIREKSISAPLFNDSGELYGHY
ncbi:hypothetical protein F5B22DRAFT_593074 [Xylaria bambusicola]|uniref:uncharacterized protein n=1 Tax=Xylaria bambusicola TaxID=326684 RepID=UPI0020072FA8|nr:uncharacterized protein F5B22DRAFT_593074 [Xylaria bambusicola]KAI0522169.1 hypothetical protein F5B22DRAFT_593074 [Xylaria bambusicola]